jgi:putative hydrolase of the HAD superfamily
MIRNVIFDVGNVFVRWSPSEVVHRCFDLGHGTDENLKRAEALFRSPTWIGLNLGKLTQAEAEATYQAQLGLTREETGKLFFHVMDHQELIEGTVAIAHRLKASGYRVFGLTDNVHEIVAHLKTRYRFWDLFEDVVVSAEIGLMKPNPAIFRHTLQTFNVAGAETVFLDDYQVNIDGARSVGIEAKLFTTPKRCEDDLRELGLAF